MFALALILVTIVMTSLHCRHHCQHQHHRRRRRQPRTSEYWHFNVALSVGTSSRALCYVSDLGVLRSVEMLLVILAAVVWS